MTTIAYRDGIIAADSCVTMSDESAGDYYSAKCLKLLECPDGIVGLQGESGPGMVFWEWYRTGRRSKRRREQLQGFTADWCAMVLQPDGLWLWDSYLVPEKVEDEFYVIGSGTKAALGALHMGATAIQAVEIACKIDPWTRGPVISMSL